MSPAASNVDDSPSGFAALARQIRGWTTNLLATGIVLAAGLAIGWQVIGWWHEQTVPLADIATTDAKALPAQLGRDFPVAGGLVKVRQVTGGSDEAQQQMRSLCRVSKVSQPRPPAGPGETAFVAQLLEQSPLEESNGVALYLPPGQAAMVVAVDRRAERIVGWSFGLPANQTTWSIYHFQPSDTALKQASP